MDSESDDEVMIHNPETCMQPYENTSPTLPVAEEFEDDNMTLLALAKPAMARKRLKRKAQAPPERANPKARTLKEPTTLQPRPPVAVTIPITISDCYNLSDEKLLKIYLHKIRGISLDRPASVEDFFHADESAVQSMAHYSNMLMNLQSAITSAAEDLIQEMDTYQNRVNSSRDHVYGEETYSEEQCQAAIADAAEKRQAQVEADLAQKAAEAGLAASTDGQAHLPVAPVYARSLATGSAERDEAFQVIAHMLAPDSRLVSKACAIEEAMFRLWGNSGANPEYRRRMQSLLERLCPEGFPGVFCAASKHRKLNGSLSNNGSSQSSSTTQSEWDKLSRESSRIRGQLWAGKTNIVKLVSEL